MHIAVCVKQVPHPEAAPTMLKVDEQARRAVTAPGLPLVTSPFDEQALEAALRLREQVGQTKITAISVGPESARNVLKHALAMGADEALLVTDEAVNDWSSEVAALVLARAVARLDGIELVLTGRQAADSDAGITGCAIAELLGWPVITFARSLGKDGQCVRVERVLSDGFEKVEAELPAVVTISNEIGPARTPSLRETMRAARKPLAARTPGELGIERAEIEAMASRRVRERLFVPVRETRCEFIGGGDERAQAAALAQRLRDAHIV